MEVSVVVSFSVKLFLKVYAYECVLPVCTSVHYRTAEDGVASPENGITDIHEPPYGV